jgi:hypothetical protein
VGTTLLRGGLSPPTQSLCPCLDWNKYYNERKVKFSHTFKVEAVRLSFVAVLDALPFKGVCCFFLEALNFVATCIFFGVIDFLVEGRPRFCADTLDLVVLPLEGDFFCGDVQSVMVSAIVSFAAAAVLATE